MEGITRNLWTLMAAILLFAMVPVTHATTIQSAAFNDGDVFVVPGGTSANWAPQVGLTTEDAARQGDSRPLLVGEGESEAMKMSNSGVGYTMYADLNRDGMSHFQEVGADARLAWQKPAGYLGPRLAPPLPGLTKAVWRGPSWTIRERWA